MRVLAIDPGYDRLGIAVLEKQNNKEVLLFSSCIETAKEDFADRLLKRGQEVTILIEKYQPHAMAIETLFFSNNQKTAMAVAQTRGTLIYLGKTKNCQIYEYSPQEIKVAVTGYGKSDKAAVINMVKRLVQNAPAKGLDDEYDAIAVGITCLAHQR